MRSFLTPSLLAFASLVTLPALADVAAPAPPAPDAPAAAATDAPTPPSPEELQKLLADMAKQQDDFNRAIGVKNGPMDGDMGVASIRIPEGFTFTDGAGAKKWAELTTNPVSGKEIGLVGPADGSYLVLFEFDDVGYVKDDEKDDLDADALLESIKEAAVAFNEQRVSAGVPAMNVLGWEQAPKFNDQAKALEWCVRAESAGQPSLNFNTRLLGRRGVVSVTLMFGGDVTFEQVLPAFRTLIGGFSFKQGETYSEFKSGDRVAAYGLAALIAGGGVALAAKTGLLSKLGLLVAKGGKLIIIGVIGVFGAIGTAFKKFFGRNKP